MSVAALVWFCTGLVRGHFGFDILGVVRSSLHPLLCVAFPPWSVPPHLPAGLHVLGVVRHDVGFVVVDQFPSFSGWRRSLGWRTGRVSTLLRGDP